MRGLTLRAPGASNPQSPEDMKKKSQPRRDGSGRTQARMKKKPAPKSNPGGATTRQPRHVGLANESRPGLGTRTDDPNPRAMSDDSSIDADSNAAPRATLHGYEEPRPEPREQSFDPKSQEEERSTGVSGHTGST
jgi:hypothetical protein